MTESARKRSSPSGPPVQAVEMPGETAPSVGRPKDLTKRAAILDAGKRLFLEAGFERTSMDAIASAAGVSKITVYSHFQDKDTLFRAVCKGVCEQQMPHEMFVLDRAAPLRQQLMQIGRAFFGLVMSPESIALNRLMTAQQEPKLAQLFWEEGPKRMKSEFTEFLAAEVAEGALAIDDTYRAAGHFFCLLKGEPFFRVSCGLPFVPVKGEVDEHVASVVDLFLRAYAPK
jgi:TetR/AcrR family transcriptional regulator, mexJK operon transcriptional repressor